MGKSLTATLFGILVKEGAYDLTRPAPIPEWQTPGDPATNVTIKDTHHWSSGLRIIMLEASDYDPSGPYPDHLCLHTGGEDSFHYAATLSLRRTHSWNVIAPSIRY